MSLSRQSSFSSVSSDSDYEEDCFYPIQKSHGYYRDFDYYYDGISNEDLQSRFNEEFERKVNWERYDIGFCKEDLLHDDGGEYILFEPYNQNQIVGVGYYGDFSSDEEGVYRLGEYDFVAKNHDIKLKPKSTLDSMIKIFNKQKSFAKKYRMLLTPNQHKFSCVLHDKPYSKYFHERDYY